jgi:hypothetical protein
VEVHPLLDLSPRTPLVVGPPVVEEACGIREVKATIALRRVAFVLEPSEESRREPGADPEVRSDAPDATAQDPVLKESPNERRGLVREEAGARRPPHRGVEGADLPIDMDA